LLIGYRVTGCHTHAELAVLLLELSDPTLKVRKLSLSAVARVLGSNTITMSPSLFALF
jgi:hypothetical protein